MKSTKRSERRHHKRRLLKKTKKIYQINRGEAEVQRLVQHNILQKIVDNMRHCSCWLCRNWGKEFGYSTLQEKKAKRLEKEGRDEIWQMEFCA